MNKGIKYLVLVGFPSMISCNEEGGCGGQQKVTFDYEGGMGCQPKGIFNDKVEEGPDLPKKHDTIKKTDPFMKNFFLNRYSRIFQSCPVLGFSLHLLLFCS